MQCTRQGMLLLTAVFNTVFYQQFAIVKNDLLVVLLTKLKTTHEGFRNQKRANRPQEGFTRVCLTMDINEFQITVLKSHASQPNSSISLVLLASQLEWPGKLVPKTVYSQGNPVHRQQPWLHLLIKLPISAPLDQNLIFF